MNHVVSLIGLGCPAHYLKARRLLRKLPDGESQIFRVETGELYEKLLANLVKDGYRCSFVSQSNNYIQLHVAI